MLYLSRQEGHLGVAFVQVDKGQGLVVGYMNRQSTGVLPLVAIGEVVEHMLVLGPSSSSSSVSGRYH